jgi:sortase A
MVSGKTVVIYDASLVEKQPQKNLKKRLGFLFLNLSLIALLLVLIPILFAELNFRRQRLTNINSNTEAAIDFGQLLSLEDKGVFTPVDWNFSLIIPKLGINAKVESSVDPTNPKEYDLALKNGVAHAQGTSFPDQPGTIYIFGHSTDYPWNIARYNALLYPLKYIEKEDEIVVIYHQKSYFYQVEEKKIAEANELDYLTSQEGEKKLVLQTCWPPGTTWKRLIVIAIPKEKDLTNAGL